MMSHFNTLNNRATKMFIVCLHDPIQFFVTFQHFTTSTMMKNLTSLLNDFSHLLGLIDHECQSLFGIRCKVKILSPKMPQVGAEAILPTLTDAKHLC